MITVDEDIHVTGPDPAWAQAFAEEQARILIALGLQASRVEHIGSTAVPEMVAKPIVDMMLGVDAYPPTTAEIESIAALGYEALGEAGVPGRAYFRLRGARSYNLHVVRLDGPIWKANIQFRAYLSENAAARSRYSAAKIEAVRNGSKRLLAYSAAKAGIVEELLREAARWSAKSLEWERER